MELKVYYKLRVRKYTPRECFRLMGVKDEDSDRVIRNQTQGSSYHLPGDSIVTTNLMAIFGELLDVDYQKAISEVADEIRQKGENDGEHT